MSTQKMMLVPFNKQRPNRDIQQLERLDNEMINIINNKHLSLNQKIDLYQEKLSKFVDKNKYLEIEQQLRPQFQTNDTGSVVKNKSIEKQIEPKKTRACIADSFTNPCVARNSNSCSSFCVSICTLVLVKQVN